ncbi:MAG: hypothetical protein OIF34_10990, partial [Porticoccaceae bacterium]|nr:hypothetical protein [Porticoccaceae bacterium]
SLTWEFFHKGQASLGWLATVLLCVVSFVAIELLAIHPGLVIALLLVAALMRREKKPAVDKDNEEVSTR